MTRHHLAQINVGRLRAQVGDPLVAEFVANLDRVNALADVQPGFVWRLTGAGNDATDLRPDPEDALEAINLSVWESLEALAAFIYRSDHAGVMRRRREWFEAPVQPYMSLWWVAAGHRPDMAEGLERLRRLREEGPGPLAFTFRQPFPAPGSWDEAPILDECA